jgi:hypothetical protein
LTILQCFVLISVMCCREFAAERRQYLPEKTIEKLEKCPVEGCDAEIVHVEKHMKRKHEIKYWGYECECGYQATLMDYGIFVRHRRVKHAHRSMCKEKLGPYRKHVTGGYYDTLRCHNCPFRGFTQDDMDKHTCEPDPQPAQDDDLEDNADNYRARNRLNHRGSRNHRWNKHNEQWKQGWGTEWGSSEWAESEGWAEWGNEGWGWGSRRWGSSGWDNQGWGNGNNGW